MQLQGNGKMGSVNCIIQKKLNVSAKNAMTRRINFTTKDLTTISSQWIKKLPSRGWKHVQQYRTSIDEQNGLRGFNRPSFFFTFAFVRRYIKNPQEGDKRTRRKFAWEKVIATDEQGRSAEIWLEWYIVTEEFHKHQEAVIEEWKVLERKLISK